jgi:prepilin signal peptidase PulO-like enzyme (type II secretory pathway)
MSSAQTHAGPLLRRPALPLITASAAFALVFARFGIAPEGFVAAVVLSTLAVLAAIDLERRIIPNAIVLPSAAVVLCAQTVFFPARAAEWALAAFGAALFLLLPALVHPGAMGMGDVKLGFLLGAALGRDVIAALALGSLTALPVALYVFARRGRGARGATLPYGPFLALGAAVVLLAGSS